MQLVPQLSILSPQEVVLKNSSFEVPYSDNVPGLFSLSLGTSTPAWITDSLQLFWTGRFGFSHKQGSYNFTDGGRGRTTDVSLLWVPASLGVKAVYAINQFPYVRPSLAMGSGLQWLYQASAVEGLSQHFLVPFYYVTPGITFFDKKTPDDWFGGFTFGITYQDSFASPQRVRATSFDLSVNIIP